MHITDLNDELGLVSGFGLGSGLGLVSGLGLGLGPVDIQV